MTYPSLPARAYLSLADFRARGIPAAEAGARRTADAARLAGGEASRSGTCAPCLRAATLSGPNSACDCADRLSGTHRALLHAAGVELATRPWATVVLLGPDSNLRRRVAGLAQAAHPFANALVDGTLPVVTGVAHLMVAIDVLPRMAEPAAGLAEFRRVACAGACLLASFPFNPDRARTEARRPVSGPGATLLPVVAHDVGWDVADLSRAAGWAQASLLEVWSDELGYARTFLLRATA